MGLTGRLRPVVDELLARGLEVRVTARDADAPHARELAARGATIAPHRAGAAGERRHGINVAQAVAQTGDALLVLFSGEGADQATGVPVLDAKHAVERGIRELGLTHTILAPVHLMQNAFNPWNVGALSAGRFALALPPDRALQQLAIEDLASVAATVAVRPAAFAGERIALAGDELTGDEAAAALSRVTGRPFAFHEVARDGLAPGMRLLFDWLERVGHRVDIPTLRRRLPEVRWQRFEQWAAARDWPERP